ncbi:MAG: hypothetical protein R2793_10655 [Flavobacteriaceae bacterium]
MKYLLAFLCCLFLFPSSKGQILFSDARGIDYFEKGSAELERGNHQLADSLLTISLNTFRNANVYFNRGLARIFQQDTLGFCEDITVSAFRYRDQQSILLFNSYCCEWVDTVYYDRRRVLTKDHEYRYFEITKKFKYENLTIGNFYDTKDRSGGNYYMGNVDLEMSEQYLAMTNSHAIASYIIESGKKIYAKTTDEVELRNLGTYRELKKKATTYFKTRYGHLKQDADKKSRLFFKIYFNELGRSYKVEYMNMYPEVSVSEEDEKKIEKELVSYIKQFPIVKPARFFNEEVPFLALDYIEF